jgi:hypothetical protein
MYGEDTTQYKITRILIAYTGHRTTLAFNDEKARQAVGTKTGRP